MPPILADRRPAGTPCHDATHDDPRDRARWPRWTPHSASSRALAGLRIQGVDLTARESVLLGCDPAGAVVLGGVVSDRLERAPAARRRPGLPGRDRRAHRPLPLAALRRQRALRRPGRGGVRRDAGRARIRLVPGRVRAAGRLHHDAPRDPRRQHGRRPGRRSAPADGWSASWAATPCSAATPAYAEAARLGPAAWPAPGSWSRPAAARARWRRPTSAPAPPHRDDGHLERALDRLAAVPVVPAGRDRLGRARHGSPRRGRRAGTR